MGQQQLILLVLATIIVGLAIVVGIRAFNENNIKSNADAMLQDAVRMANDAQAWKQKPAPFGGQAATQPAAAAVREDFTGLTLPLIGYQSAVGENCTGTAGYSNLNGCFRLTSATNTEATFHGENLKLQNDVYVRVCGLSDTEVNGSIETLGGDVIGVQTPTCVTQT
ncbi:MAG: hypothetical protein KJO98_08940 [Rhodothermia bacterium]|nr:hypothetical protein [Rhodothermia bacterium]